MMEPMTKEALLALKRRISELSISDQIQDRIVATLMDHRVGGFGMLELIAVAKARQIIHVINTGEMLPDETAED